MSKKSKKNKRKVNADFLRGYGKLREEIRKYDPSALISQIITYLYHDYGLEKVEQHQKAPWVQMLIIKWILIDPSFGKGKKFPSPSQALKIMNLGWALQSRSTLPSDFPDVLLFMRSIAYQQFSFQQGFSFLDLARQKLMFADLDSDHPLALKFEGLTGINIDDFLELSFSIVAYYISHPKPNVSRSYFHSLEESYSAEKIDRFLDLVSLPTKELRKLLLDQSPEKRLPVEYYQETPLNRYPFVKNGDQYTCWYPTVLFRCVETLLYDYLKSVDPSWFMGYFGNMFESYVGLSLSQTNLWYLKEEEIKPLIGDRKCVDYLVLENEGIVFIDAKGVEMSADAKIARNPKILKDRTRDTIIKAIDQAYSVFSSLDILEEVIPKKFHSKPPFVIVVTYKEHYLRGGEQFAQAAAGEKISRIKLQYPEHDIPLSNIFFLNIDEFDRLCEAVKREKTTFVRAMNLAIEADKLPETQKFSFSLHLIDAGFNDKPSWLSDVCNQIFDRIENKVTTDG